ncbi:MAG: hypothetical protein AB7K09_24700, partial [Planctomycetota bacterium]
MPDEPRNLMQSIHDADTVVLRTDDDDAPETDDDQASRGRQSPEGNDGEAHDVTRDAHTSSPPG